MQRFPVWQPVQKLVFFIFARWWGPVKLYPRERDATYYSIRGATVCDGGTGCNVCHQYPHKSSTRKKLKETATKATSLPLSFSTCSELPGWQLKLGSRFCYMLLMFQFLDTFLEQSVVWPGMFLWQCWQSYRLWSDAFWWSQCSDCSSISIPLVSPWFLFRESRSQCNAKALDNQLLS